MNNKTVDTLMKILFTYVAWSGQTANMKKSAVFFSKGVQSDRRMEITNLLGVQMIENTDKYLGHQLLKPAHMISSHDGLEDKFDSKTAGGREYF